MGWFAISPRIMRYLIGIDSLFGEEPVVNRAPFFFRPVQVKDVEPILEMHQRLSDNTVFNRYFSPRVPTRQEITEICQLTGENGRAIVAVIPGKKPVIVGMAYFIVSGRGAAEPALLVEDKYQGQGVGKRLLHELTCLAIEQGIHIFDALVLPGNQPIIHLLHNVGLVIQNRLDYGTREMKVQLTAVSPCDLNYQQQSVRDLTYLAV